MNPINPIDRSPNSKINNIDPQTTKTDEMDGPTNHKSTHNRDP